MNKKIRVLAFLILLSFASYLLFRGLRTEIYETLNIRNLLIVIAFIVAYFLAVLKSLMWLIWDDHETEHADEFKDNGQNEDINDQENEVTHENDAEKTEARIPEGLTEEEVQNKTVIDGKKEEEQEKSGFKFVSCDVQWKDINMYIPKGVKFKGHINEHYKDVNNQYVRTILSLISINDGSHRDNMLYRFFNERIKEIDDKDYRYPRWSKSNMPKIDDFKGERDD